MAALLFVLTHSTDDPDRATTGLATALAAQRNGHDVAFWLTGEGVRLGVAQVAETLREPGPLTAAQMVNELAENGARFYMNRACFERRGFGPDAARPGAEVAEAEWLASIVAEGRTPISL